MDETGPTAVRTGLTVLANPGSDTGSQLGGWLRRARELATEYDLADLGEELDGIARGRGRTSFQVAVVGEPGRGRTTLVNQLAGRDVIPTGPSNPVGVDVLLRPGTVDRMRVLRPSGVDLLPLTTASWKAAAADPDVVHIEVDAATTWFDETRIHLVDVPGQWPEDRPAMRALLAQSDAVLFVVSALSPFSRSERELLQADVLEKHVPAAVVVTMVDLVAAEEREESLGYLRTKLSGLTRPVPLFTGPGRHFGSTPELSALRDHLSALSGEASAATRNQRVAAQTADLARGMTARASERIAAESLSEDERRAAAESAVHELDRRTGDWDRLRVDLTGRRLALSGRLRDELNAGRTGVLEALRWELQRAHDPREWWERDLPVLWGRRMADLVRRSERTLTAGLATDTQWLDEETSSRFAVVAGPFTPGRSNLAAAAEVAGSVSDLGRTKLITRISAQGGAILGYLIAAAQNAPMPLYGAAFSLVGGILAEASIRAAVERQRREVDDLLVRGVDEGVAALADRAADALERLYADVFNRLRDLHLRWHADRMASIDEAAAPAGPDWRKLARASASLAQEIETAQSRSDLT